MEDGPNAAEEATALALAAQREAEERAAQAEQTAEAIADAARETAIVRTVEERMQEMDEWRTQHAARVDALAEQVTPLSQSYQTMQSDLAETRDRLGTILERLTPPEPLTPPPPPEEPNRSVTNPETGEGGHADRITENGTEAPKDPAPNPPPENRPRKRSI